MATLIIIAILAGTLYVLIGLIAASASRVEPYVADIKRLSFWTFVIALAGAVFHKIL